MLLIFTALHCTVLWLFSTVPRIVSVGSRFSAEETSVSIPLEETAEMDPGTSVLTIPDPGIAIIHTILYPMATLQVSSTCVPRGASTGSCCSKNIISVY